MSQELSDFIQREIKQRGIAERELSRQASLSYGTAHYIINHPESNPNRETCVKLANALDLPESLLFQLAGYSEIVLPAELDATVTALAIYLNNLPPATRPYALEGCWSVARLVAEVAAGREVPANSAHSPLNGNPT